MTPCQQLAAMPLASCVKSQRLATRNAQQIFVALALSILFLLLLEVPTIRAEESRFFAVKTEVIPSTTVGVGENIQILITLNSSEKMALSTFSLPSMEGFHLIRQNILPFKENRKGKWESVLSIELLALEIGEFEFPQLNLPFQNSSGEVSTLQTPPLKIKVITGLDGEVSAELLRDIYGPLSVSSWFLIWFLLLLMLAGVVLWRMRSSRNKTPTPQPLPPILPPHELALQKLEEARQRFERDGELKLFFSELSFIFRSYLNERYSTDAMEKTTSEIFSEMRSLGIERKLCLEAKEFLSFCDLVKFAKFLPKSAEIEEQVERIKSWIHATKEVEKEGVSIQ